MGVNNEDESGIALKFSGPAIPRTRSSTSFMSGIVVAVYV